MGASGSACLLLPPSTALDEEMQAEFALHLDLCTRALIVEGFAADEARRRARMEFGSLARYEEKSREARRFERQGPERTS